MVDYLINSQKGDTMAEDTTVVSEDDIADVSLIDTPIAPAADAAASDTADKGKDDAADTKPADKPAEGDKPDAKDTEAKDAPAAKAAEATKPADKPAEGEDQDKKPEEEEAAKQPSPEEQRAEQQRRAAQEYQNRQRTRQQVEQQIDQAYGPKSQDQLVSEGMDPSEARVEALRQEMTYDKERSRIAELNAGMQADAVNVEADFGVFNPKSTEYDEEFTRMVDAQYRTAARIQTVQTGVGQDGRPIEVVSNAEVPLYDFYQRMANIYGRGTSKGSEMGQAEMAAMMSRTENPGGSSSTGKGDSLADLEERLGDVVIT